LKLSGIPFLIREFIQKNKVTIILYHDISVENAQLHFNYLRKRYNIIPLQTFLIAHKENRVKHLPKKSLIITIDDGHKGNYKLLPLIKKLQIPITIFLCSHIICTNKKYWFKHDLKDFDIERLKKFNNQERLKFLLLKGYDQDNEYDSPSSLSNNEILEMSEYVDFQSHSMLHPCLPYCTDQESEMEILGSKKLLEENFKFTINAFSYPNGDYSDREIEFLKRYGYEAGITCDLFFNSQKTDVYRLKRLGCRDEASLAELEVKISGLYFFLKGIFFKKNFGYTKKTGKTADENRVTDQ